MKAGCLVTSQTCLKTRIPECSPSNTYIKVPSGKKTATVQTGRTAPSSAELRKRWLMFPPWSLHRKCTVRNTYH